MQEYTKLLEIVKSYIQDDNNPEVENGKISLYDLYYVIDESVKELYKEKEAKKLIAKIKKEIAKKKGNFLTKKEILKENLSVRLGANDKSVYISIRNEVGTVYLIVKDLNSNNIYVKNLISNNFSLTKAQKEILDKHYEEIREILAALEEYKNIFGADYLNFSKNDQQFSDGVMDVRIICDSFGRVKSKININKKIDPQEISSINYVNKEIIQNTIDNNKFKILKKVVVNKEDLNESYKKMIKRKELVRVYSHKK